MWAANMKRSDRYFFSNDGEVELRGTIGGGKITSLDILKLPRVSNTTDLINISNAARKTGKKVRIERIVYDILSETQKRFVIDNNIAIF